MATENDIRKFIQENKIRVPKDDKFMEDLVRQINLLPTPACLDEKEKNTEECVRIISLISKALKQRNRRIAIESLIVNIATCGIILCLAFAMGCIDSDSSIIQTLVKFRYLICGILCTAFVLMYNRKLYFETFQ